MKKDETYNSILKEEAKQLDVNKSSISDVKDSTESNIDVSLMFENIDELINEVDSYSQRIQEIDAK